MFLGVFSKLFVVCKEENRLVGGRGVVGRGGACLFAWFAHSSVESLYI